MSPANVGPHVTGQTSSTVAQWLIKVHMGRYSALHCIIYTKKTSVLNKYLC